MKLSVRSLSLDGYDHDIIASRLLFIFLRLPRASPEVSDNITATAAHYAGSMAGAPRLTFAGALRGNGCTRVHPYEVGNQRFACRDAPLEHPPLRPVDEQCGHAVGPSGCRRYSGDFLGFNDLYRRGATYQARPFGAGTFGDKPAAWRSIAGAAWRLGAFPNYFRTDFWGDFRFLRLLLLKIT